MRGAEACRRDPPAGAGWRTGAGGPLASSWMSVVFCHYIINIINIVIINIINIIIIIIITTDTATGRSPSTRRRRSGGTSS